MTLVKDGKATFIQGELLQCSRMGFLIVDRDWAQFLVKGKVGIYSQEKGWESVDRKLIRENFKSKGNQDWVKATPA